MSSLRSALSTPDRKRTYVRRLFATIAPRYDLITRLLSYGRDRHWKQRLVELARVAPEDRAVDLACGTGDIALLLREAGARVVALDVTARMIELARVKPGADRVAFLVGDMMTLPFPAGSFDLVTTGYGIRNAPVIEAALAESHRVLKPGGRLLSLDFDRPAHPLVRTVYLAYLGAVGSAVGLLLHGDADTYRYIPATIRRYPGAAAVVELMRHVGFHYAGHQPVLGGLMAIHVARK
jgi:demethylmenaquinone methyltransferase/2-methoxy-6-polyprenyl-1,4-benzoquinol methylase